MKERAGAVGGGCCPSVVEWNGSWSWPEAWTVHPQHRREVENLKIDAVGRQLWGQESGG